VIPKHPPFRRHPVCLLLAIAFAAVVGFFPPAQYTGKEAFIEYLIVASAVGLFLPLILSAIVYWSLGRSQLAANFTFGFLVALFLGGAVFNMTKSGKEVAAKLEAQVRTQLGEPPAPGTAAAPAAATTPHIVTKGSPEIRVYKRPTASAPER
jgi:hypothetical protein